MLPQAYRRYDDIPCTLQHEVSRYLQTFYIGLQRRANEVSVPKLVPSCSLKAAAFGRRAAEAYAQGPEAKGAAELSHA